MRKKFWLKTLINTTMIAGIISCSKSQEKTTLPVASGDIKTAGKPVLDSVKTHNKAAEAVSFCCKNKLNTDFAILIDMSLHSGVNRFFVYDFNAKKITQQHLVGHGCGSNSWSADDSKDSPEFSNTDGSHLSSLGKYKIGTRGVSE